MGWNKRGILRNRSSSVPRASFLFLCLRYHSSIPPSPSNQRSLKIVTFSWQNELWEYARLHCKEWCLVWCALNVLYFRWCVNDDDKLYTAKKCSFLLLICLIFENNIEIFSHNMHVFKKKTPMKFYKVLSSEINSLNKENFKEIKKNLLYIFIYFSDGTEYVFIFFEKKIYDFLRCIQNVFNFGRL